MFCVLLMMCLKLLSDAAREIGLPSRQVYELKDGGVKPCLTRNNETGVYIEIRLCPTMNHSIIQNYPYSGLCGFRRLPKVCCPKGTNSKSLSLKQSANNAKPDNINWGECGKSNRTLPLVVGGKNATLGDWPWMVALYYKSSKNSNRYFHCGGSLISDRWVVTAAHCIRNISGTLEPSMARLGDLNLDESVDDKAHPIDVFIKYIIIHGNYSQSPIINDIALLHLQEAVQFSKYIRPICLLRGAEYRKDSYYKRKRPYIIGWGRLAFNGSLSAALQETSLPIINSTYCAEVFAQQSSAQIDDTVLCAGEHGKDSCQGDSGGPLIFPNTKTKTWYLGGIVSYGIRCADNFPGVYTRVAAFTDWISENTGLKF